MSESDKILRVKASNLPPLLLQAHQVPTCGPRWAVTLVGVDQVNAAASVLTGVAVALLNLDVTDGARVPSVAFAGKGGDSIFAHTVMARLRHAVVNVLLAE